MRFLKTLILLLFCNSSYAQFFEGIITQEKEYIPKTRKTVVVNDLKKLYGSEVRLYLKGNKYMQIYNGVLLEKVLYNQTENRIYNVLPKQNIIVWENADKQTEKLISYEIKPNYDTLMGLACDLFILDTDESTNYYLYSQKYKIDTQYFKKYNSNLYNLYLEKTDGSIPLQSRIDYKKKDYSVITTTINIEPETLSDEDFAINDYQILPDNDALDTKSEPNGGLKDFYQFFAKNASYPKIARKAGIQGYVYLGFIVNEDNSISNIEVIKGIHESCDQEAVNVLKQYNNWQAGTLDNQPVKTFFVLPVGFLFR